MPRPAKIWLSADEDFLRENYKVIPIKELAKKFGVSASSIKSKAFSLGLSTRRNYVRQYHNRIISMLQKKYSYRAIARELGIPRSSVANYCHRQNINQTNIPKTNEVILGFLYGHKAKKTS